MGDRVDLWGGLPDRPKPYFTAQQRRRVPETPWTLPPPSTSDRVERAVGRRRSFLIPAAALFAVACASLVQANGGFVGPGSIDYWVSRFSASPLAVEARPRFFRDSDGTSHTLFTDAGSLGSGAVRVLVGELDAARAEPGDLVALSSGGGDTAQAMAVGDAIRARGLYTVVGRVSDGILVPSSCASACVMAFAGGSHRIALDRSVLGVHQFTPVDPGSIDDPISYTQRAMGLTIAYFSRMGIDADVVAAGAASKRVVWIDLADARRWRLVDVVLARL